MHVKSIIIDGFKSYGRRVEIKQFDPSFNAITGLNGTGKSNILDALCFVMGISNLSSVRAHSLEELVYKQGQANVNKASVTVVFDNSNKEHSPPGYEDRPEITITRQVVIGGKNKYMINGVTVQNTRVADLFKSVQLNVNNPHFLIMQGKITKVLNMKPKEILGMVEEAAGTRMYKTKKEQSLKTMEKKDLKLEEVNRTLNEELGPKIDRLRQERAHYLELQKCTREIETLSRQDTAHRFFEMLQQQEATDAELQKVEKKVEKLEAAGVSAQEETVKLDEQLRQLQKKREQEGDGALNQLETELRDAVTAEAKLTAASKSLEDTAASEGKRRQQILKSIKSDEKLLEEKGKKFTSGKDEFTTADAKTKELTDAVEAARKRHEAASMGMSVDEHGNVSSLQQQRIAAEKSAIHAKTQADILKMQMQQLKKELAAKKAELKSTAGQDIEQEKNTLKSLENQLAKLQSKLDQESGSEEAYEEAKQRFKEISREVARLNEQVEDGLRAFPWARLDYEDPYPNFDRSKVSGLVCNLFTMKKSECAVALETVAGGGLFNVIVDTEDTAKALIRKSAQRRTYLPLNKIQSQPLSNNVIAAAKRIAGADNVWAAIDLIEFEPRYRPVMVRIFGNALVCRTQEIAKTLPFDRSVGCQCVSLEGDSFSPSGVMSGGSTDKKRLLLPALDKTRDARKNLDVKRTELRQLEQTTHQSKQRAEALVRLRAEIGDVEHRVKLCRESIANSNRGRLELENQELERQLETADAGLKTAVTTEAKAVAQMKDLDARMKEGKASIEREKKQAEKEFKLLQQQLDKHKQATEDKIQAFSTLEAEMDELRAAIEAAQQEAKDVAAAVQENEAKLDSGRGDLEEAREKLRELKSSVAKEKERLNKQNKEMQQISNRKDKLAKEQSDRELELKKFSHSIEKVKEDLKVLVDQLARLERKYDWIAADKHLFGQKGGPYEFTEPEKVAEKLGALESRRKGLEKRTNSNAQHVLAKVEEQLQELMKKKGIVENDREKLKTVIEELDKKMIEALDVAWQKINKDFGAIFSTLLIGATAKLEPTGHTNKILDGLEVHVGFNGKWKEGLSELSGGQRSLVALSLVLAMLQFKPAPIYILDEVDAALDPSHTENIGELVQKHFKQSQFIIVSLKDGMFKNANVLFKTKLVDGVSGVDRIAQGKKK